MGWPDMTRFYCCWSALGCTLTRPAGWSLLAAIRCHRWSKNAQRKGKKTRCEVRTYPNHVTSCDITATSSIPWYVITWRPQWDSLEMSIFSGQTVHVELQTCCFQLLRFWKLSGLRCLRGAIIIVRETFESRRNISLLLRMEMDENWRKRMESACKNWMEYPSPSVSRGTETCKTHFHPKHSKPCETELLFSSYQWNFSRFKHNPEILLKFVQNRSDWIKQNKASFKF